MQPSSFTDRRIPINTNPLIQHSRVDFDRYKRCAWEETIIDVIDVVIETTLLLSFIGMSVLALCCGLRAMFGF